MSPKSPAQIVVERFGKNPGPNADRKARRKAREEAKRALVNTLADLLEHPEDEEKEAFKERLFFVSNSKLLKLLATQERLKKEFGTKQNLVEAILAHQKRSKDESYRARLLSHSVGRLLTMAPKQSTK